MNILDLIPFLRSFRRFRQSLWLELIAFVLTFVLFFLAEHLLENLASSEAGKLVRKSFAIDQSTDLVRIFIESDIISVFIFIITFMLTLFFLNKIHELILKAETNSIVTNGLSESENWYVQGDVEFMPNNEIIVTNSAWGMLYKRRIFLNPWIAFTFNKGELEPQGNEKKQIVIGVLFRALDLENYYMCQIIFNREGNDDYLELIPHICLEGKWCAQSIRKIHSEGEVAQIFTDNDINIEVSVLDNILTLKVGQLQKAIQLNNSAFVIPIYNFNRFGELISQTISENDGKLELNRRIMVKDVSFQNSPGMIGFRAYSNEGGIIKNLRIVEQSAEDRT